MERKPTPNAEHRTPNIEWTRVREDEGDYGAKTETFNVQRSTLNAQRRKETRFDLEERLLAFSACIIELVDLLPNTRAGNHVAGQLLRCGTSPYGNHGEVQAAESRRDFVHKLRICLKELKETRRWLRLIQRAALLPEAKVAPVLRETEELIKIFFTSIRTAEANAR
jgi:four helix bundle protein